MLENESSYLSRPATIHTEQCGRDPLLGGCLNIVFVSDYSLNHTALMSLQCWMLLLDVLLPWNRVSGFELTRFMKRGEHGSPSRDARTQGRSAFWTCSPGPGPGLDTGEWDGWWRELMLEYMEGGCFGCLTGRLAGRQGLCCGGRRRSDQPVSMSSGRDCLPRCAGCDGNGRYRGRYGHGL